MLMHMHHKYLRYNMMSVQPCTLDRQNKRHENEIEFFKYVHIEPIMQGLDKNGEKFIRF